MNSEMSSPFKERGISKVREHIKLPVFYLLLAGAIWFFRLTAEEINLLSYSNFSGWPVVARAAFQPMPFTSIVFFLLARSSMGT